MKNLLLQLFTWWNGQTMGTRWFTARHGEKVGTDEFGNTYYRAPSKLPASIAERRWVIYANYAEASMIPPGWHGWMHHRTDTPPSEIGVRSPRVAETASSQPDRFIKGLPAGRQPVGGNAEAAGKTGL